MSDDRVRTTIRSGAQTFGLQEFLIVHGGAPPIDDIRFEGAADAGASPAVLAALAHRAGDHHRTVEPDHLDRPDPRDRRDPRGDRGRGRAGRRRQPDRRRQGAQGPDHGCLSWAGATADAAGVARHYGPLIDAIVADEPVEGIRSRDCDTWMGSSTARRELAAQTLELADTLAG